MQIRHHLRGDPSTPGMPFRRRLATAHSAPFHRRLHRCRRLAPTALNTEDGPTVPEPHPRHRHADRVGLDRVRALQPEKPNETVVIPSGAKTCVRV